MVVVFISNGKQANIHMKGYGCSHTKKHGGEPKEPNPNNYRYHEFINEIMAEDFITQQGKVVHYCQACS